MAVSNTVEAVLVGSYQDKITSALQQTLRTVEAGMHAAVSGAIAAVSGASTAWTNFGQQMINSGNQGGSSLQTFGLAFVGWAVLAVGAVGKVASAIVGFIGNLTKEASEVLELKLAYESLTATMGVAGDKMLGDLKRGTEGLVSGSVLLRNANRILSAEIPITAEQYTLLVGNVFRLAKASGVDATQAINTLTDSIIRGNARGLQALGLNMGHVKDAISQVAEASGQSANSLENSARLQTYYNELLAVSSNAVRRNSADYFSFADAIQKASNVFGSWQKALGEGIGRSGVFEALLQQMSQTLDEIGPKRDNVTALALAVNAFLIGTLRGFAQLLEIVAAFGPIWASLYAGIKAICSAIIDILALVLSVVSHLIGRIFEALSMIPGGVGAMFRPLVGFFAQTRDQLQGISQAARASFESSFEGFGSGVVKLEGLASATRETAAQMERYRNEVIRGEAGTRAATRVEADRTETLKKLKQQLEEHKKLWDEIRKAASPALDVYSQYFETLKRIEADKLADDQQKQTMRTMLVKATAEKLVQIERDRKNKAVEGWLEETHAVEQLSRVAQDAAVAIKDIQIPGVLNQQPKNFGDDPAHKALNDAELQRRSEFQAIQDALRASNDRTTPGWLKSLREAHVELQKLNSLKMNPFHQTMAAMKNSVLDFASGAGNAFAQFMSDLVSGQEGAGKRLLAAFLSMIGQLLVKNGVMLIQVGMAEIALASTVVGRLMGASHAAGVHAIAVGAIQAGIGGALMGAGAALTQSANASSSTAASSSSYQTSGSSSAASPTQIIKVGAAGRAQDAGAASERRKPEEITVRLALDSKGVLNVVEQNIRSNGRLRVVLAGA